MKTFEELTPEEMYEILGNRDELYAGVFYVGVSSTKIYCRPGCWARRPKFENCKFFKTKEECEALGYRACKLCKPNEPKELK